MLPEGYMESTSVPTKKELTHERILGVASSSIRRTGFQGVGVADIMRQAGLTHGGFYAHFPSRNALLAEALAYAGDQSHARLVRAMEQDVKQGSSRFSALVRNYLADRHLKSAESGCPVAALASEMPRQAAEVREAAKERVRSLVDFVQDCMPADAGPGHALQVASQMVGALQLARACGDNAQGRALLELSRRALIERFDPQA